MEKPPLQDDKYITPLWANWFDRIWKVAGSIDASGSTAQRPTIDLFIGKSYFDTTLNKPIWVKAYTGGSAIWVDATGGVV